MLFVITFIITSITIPLIIKICNKKNVFTPKDERHIHTRNICAFGGISIFLGIFMSQTYLLLDFPDFSTNFTSYYVLAFAAFILFLVGFVDDLIDLNAKYKFVIQLLIALVLVFRVDVYIQSFYGLFGLYELPLWFAYTFSVVTIVFFINAFNLIDGIDALSSSIGMFALAVFSYFFFVSGAYYDFLIAVSVFAALLGFWFYNKPPAKIFMGDSGTLSIGLLLAYFAIKMCNLPLDDKAVVSPVFVMMVLMYPVIDTLRVFVKRITKKTSPFTPDRSHLHHSLLDLGLSHGKTVFVIIAISVVFSSMAYLLRTQITTSFFILTLLVVIISQLPKIMLKKRQQNHANHNKQKTRVLEKIRPSKTAL